MTKVITGDRVGKLGVLRVGCTAAIFDDTGQRVLLTCRSDNGFWCLPGGGMDAGESALEACAREVLEETGLEVEVGRLIGVYTTPHMLVEFPDGNRIQPVALLFVAKPVGGTLGISYETTDAGYFSVEDMKVMNVWDHHRQLIYDSLAGVKEAFVR